MKMGIAIIGLMLANAAWAGLADSYPGDVGLCADPAVVFCDDFESYADTAALLDSANWDAKQLSVTLGIDSPSVSSGTKSARFDAVNGGDTGGTLFVDIADNDTLFYRYYVKYGPGFAGAGHSGVWGGGRLTPNGFPWGDAGSAPTEKHWILFQPWASGRLDMYGYFANMGCITFPTTCFGNSFIQDAGLVYESDAWHLVEFMVKMNSPNTSTNGELRLWYDGVEIIYYGDGFPNATDASGLWTPDTNGPFPGFEWTTSAADHSNNMVWISLFEPSSTLNMSVDDLVVATQYIGPISSGASVRGAAITGGSIQ